MSCTKEVGKITGFIYYKETDLKIVDGKKVPKRKYKKERIAFVENDKGIYKIPLSKIFLGK